MDFIIQQIVNALSLGGIYALLALGLAIVFSIVRLINFAHGELMTLGGYGVWFALLLAWPAGAAAVLGIVVAALAAVSMERVAFRPMRGADVTTLLITSFAISEIVKVLFQNGISARPVAIVLPAWISDTITFGSVSISVTALVSMATVALSLAAMHVLLRRTVLGIAMRAAAEDFPVVRLMGIRANQVVATAFAISGALAGVAAVLWVAQRGSVDPLMGATPVLKAFITTVVGGLGSLSGAVVGGFVVGAIEVFAQAFLPSAMAPYRDAVVLTVVIAILVARPSGLIPASKVDRS